MNDTAADSKTVFRPGKAHWLKRQGAKSLDGEQKALLLALAQLDTELGRELSAEEAAALEELERQIEGYDAADIATAVRKMVETPSDPERRTSWPELKGRK